MKEEHFISMLLVQLSHKSQPWILPSFSGILTWVKFAIVLIFIGLLLSRNSSREISMLKTISSRRTAHISDPGFQAQSSLDITKQNVVLEVPWECSSLHVSPTTLSGVVTLLCCRCLFLPHTTISLYCDCTKHSAAGNTLSYST